MNTIVNPDVEELLKGKLVYSYIGGNDDDMVVEYTVLGLAPPCIKEGKNCTDCMCNGRRAWLWRVDKWGKPSPHKEDGELFCLNSDDFTWDEDEL